MPAHECVQRHHRHHHAVENASNSSRLWDLAGSRSGIGSEVASTHEIRLALEQVISSYGITSMLDAPCGDLTWMPLVRGIDQVRYTGADISAKVLEGNWGKYPAVEATGPTSTAFGTGAGFRNAVFVQADLVDAVPLSADGGSHDLIFVRSVQSKCNNLRYHADIVQVRYE